MLWNLKKNSLDYKRLLWLLCLGNWVRILSPVWIWILPFMKFMAFPWDTCWSTGLSRGFFRHLARVCLNSSSSQCTSEEQKPIAAAGCSGGFFQHNTNMAKRWKSQNMNDSHDHTNLRCSSFSFWRYKQSKNFPAYRWNPGPTNSLWFGCFFHFWGFGDAWHQKKGKILTHTGWPFGRWACNRCIQGHIYYIQLYNMLNVSFKYIHGPWYICRY